MGEWTAISLRWWRVEEGKQERKCEAGQMTVGCIHTKTDMRLSKWRGRGVTLKCTLILFQMLPSVSSAINLQAALIQNK